MTAETLMTDAATTTEGAASTDATTATAAQAVPASDASTQQQAAAGQTSPDADKAGAASDKGEQADAKPTGAPEKYEFAMPDGVQMDEAGLKAFEEVARDLDLSQEAAQKVISKMAPAMAARQAEAVAQVKAEWVEGAKADKEFGGDKLAQNLSVAKKALDQFGTPELRTLLNESGLGNHPEIIRAFFRAGKAISEDRFVAAGNGGQTGKRDYAASLYPSQQS